MPTGKVKWFDAEKGFGFVSQEDGPDVYLRADALPEGTTTVKAGTRVQLDPDDAYEALNAASAICDDRLQRMQSGRVAPERFTHGTSQQRVEWFRRGMSSGDPNVCNTFQ